MPGDEEISSCGIGSLDKTERAAQPEPLVMEPCEEIFACFESLAHGSQGNVLPESTLQRLVSKLDAVRIASCLGVRSSWPLRDETTLCQVCAPIGKRAYPVSIRQGHAHVETWTIPVSGAMRPKLKVITKHANCSSNNCERKCMSSQSFYGDTLNRLSLLRPHLCLCSLLCLPNPFSCYVLLHVVEPKTSGC